MRQYGRIEIPKKQGKATRPVYFTAYAPGLEANGGDAG